jgi:hypothetical protein
MLAGAVVLLAAFVLWQRRAAHPLLPLSVILNRNRGAAYSSILIAGAGMFGIFLFVTYYLQVSLKFSPIQTGLSFLPMIGMLVVAAQLGTNLLVPRFGPKVMVPFGMTVAAIGMVLLTRLDLGSEYVPDILIPLMILGFGIGLTMSPMSTAAMNAVVTTKAGVASGVLSMFRMIGGTFGVAALGALFQNQAQVKLDETLSGQSGLTAADRADFAHQLTGGAPHLDGVSQAQAAKLTVAGHEAFVSFDAAAYLWGLEFTSAEWVGLVSTHSDHMRLEPAESQALLTGLGQVIDDFGGTVRTKSTTIALFAEHA